MKAMPCEDDENNVIAMRVETNSDAKEEPVDDSNDSPSHAADAVSTYVRKTSPIDLLKMNFEIHFFCLCICLCMLLDRDSRQTGAAA
jgi:hypothetical protein